MIGQWLARIPRRTLMIGGVMVLVGGYWLWTSAAHPRMQAMWQAATELSQPIPAHENAIVGGLRQNREESIQHARAIAELEAQASRRGPPSSGCKRSCSRRRRNWRCARKPRPRA